MKIEAQYIEPGDIVLFDDLAAEVSHVRVPDTLQAFHKLVRSVGVIDFDPDVRLEYSDGTARWYSSREPMDVLAISEQELTMRMLAA